MPFQSNYYRSRTFIAILLLAFVISLKSSAKKPTDKDFLKKQFWVGLKGSGFFTGASPIKRYTIFNSTSDLNSSIYNKQYDNFNKITGGGGLEITFTYKAFGVSLQPDFRRTTIIYTNNYLWTDPQNSTSNYKATYHSVQKLDYFFYPLLFKYSFLKSKIKMFLEAGGYFAYLNNANKTTKVTLEDYASGGNEPYIALNVTTGAKELFIKSNLGWIAGTGISYPIGNVRLSASANYWNNTHNITNVSTRFENDRLTGIGDVMDDVKLRNISFSVACLIPLRFLEKGNLTAE